MVMVVRRGAGTTTLFLTPADPRAAFYYGWRPDSTSVEKTLGVRARSFASVGAVADSLAAAGLPLYTLDDFEDADFSRADSLTRGRVFTRSLVAKHPGLVAKDAAPLVDQLRAKKSAAEIALLRKAAEISSEGHRAAMTAPVPVARVRASSRARVHLHPARRVASGVRVDRRLGTERNAAPLHERPRRNEAGRRCRDRRGDGVRRLRGRHHADDSGERHVHARAARDVSARARRAGSGGAKRAAREDRRRRRRTRPSPSARAGSRSSG